MRFLEAVSGQIAAAIGRAELFGHVVELALEDALTGLANRRALDERLEPAVEAALERGEDLSLLVCDLDNLKQINDTGGHASGDEALVRVARVLEGAAGDRDDAFATRISGDEFCLVLPAVEVASARAWPRGSWVSCDSGRRRSASPQVSRRSERAHGARPTCCERPTRPSTRPSAPVARGSTSPSRILAPPGASGARPAA
jgi:GGDEF domain-containing protein